MRIVFIGTVSFSERALKKLILMDADVVGVCTKKQSIENADFSDLAPVCKKNDIPYQFVVDINSNDNIEWVKSLNPDIIFCFGWSSIIKKELLKLPPMGVIGYHPAKLPENRGRHPIIWAIALGLQKSASTFFFMQEGVDDGEILSQVDFEILDDEDAKAIYEKIVEIALGQIEVFVPSLKSNAFNKIKQNHSMSNVWRKRTKQDGVIDFRMSTDALYNLIRALTHPYAGAHLLYHGKEIIIWKSERVLCKLNNFEYGKVLDVCDKSIVVKTYDGAIRFLEHEFDVLPTEGDYL